MTSYENVFEYYNMENAVANYHAIGKPEEIIVQSTNGNITGEEYFNLDRGSGITENNPFYGLDYENFLKNSEKFPMCTGSSGNVFSLGGEDDVPEPSPEQWAQDPVPEPEPGYNNYDYYGPVDPFLGSHMTDRVFPAITFTPNADPQCIPTNTSIPIPTVNAPSTTSSAIVTLPYKYFILFILYICLGFKM